MTIFPTRSRGFSLIELMIAMLIGLIVIAGVVSIFLSGQRSYRSNQALGDVQDSARVAFEMLAQDIRRAGLTGCDNAADVANVLKNSPNDGGTTWWANFGNAVRGYDAGATDNGAGTRVANTDSINLIGAMQNGFSLASNSEPDGQFTLNEARSDLRNGDIVVICDPSQTAIVQISSVNGTGTDFQHKHDSATSPGNCSGGLGFPTVCTAIGNSHPFGKNALVAKLQAVDWYVGTNPDGGKSLYRSALENTTGTPAPVSQEMVRNVTDLQFQYHQSGNTAFLDASAITDWTVVDAVRAALTIESEDKNAGVGATPISRSFSVTTTLRNRVN